MRRFVEGGGYKGSLDVVTLGAAAVDLVAIVDKLPEPDQMVFAEEFREFPGGSTANVAVALAKLGCKVGFIGKLGNDRFGRMLIDDFKRAGVDVSRVIVEDSARSASTFIAVDRKGNKVIYSLGGKALVESPKEVDLSYITKSRITYVGEAYPSVVMEPLSLARKMGIFIVSNLGVNLSLFGVNALKLARISDLVVISSRELSLLDINVERAAKSILKEGPKAIIMTMGERALYSLRSTI